MQQIYGVYKNARNAAWQCLIDFKVNALPVDLQHIARQANIRILRNADIHVLQPSESGLSLYDGQQWFVVFDETDSRQRRRFTVAHEFGHIFLGHTLRAESRFARTFVKDKPVYETEADIFASRLLAPACVLWALNLHTAEEIADVCNISITAAQIRAQRMEVLYARNRFLTHPLERQVLENFELFVRDHTSKRGG